MNSGNIRGVTCDICGKPCGPLGVCKRTSMCRPEYYRRWRAKDITAFRSKVRDGNRARSATYRERLPHDQKLYAVWFPRSEVLKVGFSTCRPCDLVRDARSNARKRAWYAEDGYCIWLVPGDVRAEAFIQSVLSFCWKSAFWKSTTRLSEWFSVPGLTEEEILDALVRVTNLFAEVEKGWARHS